LCDRKVFQNVQFFLQNKAEALLLSTCLIYRHFKSWLKSFFRSKYLHENITSCQWNYYAIFFPTLEENQIVIEMNRNSQLHNKKSTESTFNFFFVCHNTTEPKKKILAYLFFLLFAPTLIPEAFQIKTVCSKKIITKVLKKLSVNDQNYFLLISHTLERNKPSHSNQFYCKKNYYCIEKKIKILPFLQWIVIKCAKPLHPKLPTLCPPNVFCCSSTKNSSIQ